MGRGICFYRCAFLQPVGSWKCETRKGSDGIMINLNNKKKTTTKQNKTKQKKMHLCETRKRKANNNEETPLCRFAVVI